MLTPHKSNLTKIRDVSFWRATAFAGSFALLMGCSAPSTAPSLQGPVALTQPQPQALPQTYASSGTTLSVAGQIIAMNGSNYLVDSNVGCGRIWVNSNSSTKAYGGVAAKGLNVTATGTGSCSTSVAATQAVFTPALLTVSGSVLTVSASQITLNAGASCGKMPVVLNAQTATYNKNLPVAVGQNVQVSGGGSCASGMTATLVVGGITGSPAPVPSSTAKPVATPTPAATAGPSIATSHILTADYLGYNSFTNWSAAAPWLTWATIPAQQATTVGATGIKTMFYTDPNRQAAGDPMFTSDDSTYEHTCGGSKMTTVLGQDVMKVSSANMLALWKGLVASRETYGHIDAMFEDNAGGLNEYGTSSFSGLPCNYNDATRITDDQNMEQGLGHAVIYNGLGGLNGEGVSQSIALNKTTLGGTFEHCYAQIDYKPKTFDWNWRATEDTEIQMAQQNKLFFCMPKDVTSATSSADGRQYVYASLLLTYNVNSTVLWSTYTSTSGVTVDPESELVALNPKVATPSDISGLLTPGGVYAREYGACYIKGVSVGGCAFVVNSDYYNARTFPYTNYHHSLVMHGGAILDGGTITADGPAPSATIQKLESAIVFQ